MPILFLVFLLFNVAVLANTHTVGIGQQYATPNALYQAGVVQSGDTVEIFAGTYSGQEALAVWQADDLLLRGVGSRPHLVANGQNIWGKGIWVFAGDDIIVENIEFSGAVVPDKNGAGIRLDGTGLTARHCYFHHNETGILTSNPEAGDILVEYCEFGYNGNGDGFSHNIYVGRVNSLTFQYNYSHHASVGHNLKSRAVTNHILYNRIMDESSGNSSRLIDLPNGGTSILIGNLLMQGPNAPNSNLVGYGLEGLSNPQPHNLYVINNTFVNKRPNSGRYLDFPSTNVNAVAINNIFGGDGILSDNPLSMESNNLFESDLTLIGFVDEPNYDYRLLQNSLAVNVGTDPGSLGGFNLTPIFEYVHLTTPQDRMVNGDLDAGAYEYFSSAASDIAMSDADIGFYPNPTEGLFTLRGSLSLFDLDILRSDGTLFQTILPMSDTHTITLDALPAELLYLEVRHKTIGTMQTRTVLKAQ